MGGQAWLDGHPLYSHDAKFHTPIGLNLPFTYPPLAAVIFAPFAWLGMPAASITITLITLALLLVSTMIVLTRLDVWTTTRLVPGPAWLRRWWLTALIVAWATLYWEPIKANFAFGQINVVLMTLVIADCVPRRTPWPRGLLLGLGIALKLTPAVFLLYFVLRRDRRAVFTSLASVVTALAAGFALAWHDSWEYWTHTVRNTDRDLARPVLNTNQNIAGTLARLGPGRASTIPALGGRLLPGARADDLGGAPGAARRRADPGGDVYRAVRAGGVAGVLVASLGLGAADGVGDDGAGLAAAKPRAGLRERRRGGHHGVDADRPASQAPRGGRRVVAATRRGVISVVGVGDHRGSGDYGRGRRGDCYCAPGIERAGAGFRRQLIGAAIS